MSIKEKFEELLGYTRPHQQNNRPLDSFRESEPSVPEVDPEALLPAEDLEAELEPRSLATNPLAKIALVMSGTFGLVLIAAAFLNVFGSIRLTTPLAVERSSQSRASVPAGSELDPEVARLKTQLALREQADQLQALQAARVERPAAEPLVEKPPAATPQPKVMPKQPATPPRTLLKSPLKSQPAPRAAVKKDPKQEWLFASTIGSYGQAPNSPVTLALVEEEVELSHSGKKVLVGTRAAAELTANATWTGAEPYDITLVVRLLEPVLYEDGSVAFPEQSQLVAVLHPSSSERVYLNVAAILIPQNEGFQEIPLDRDLMGVRGRDGRLLLAQLKDAPNESRTPSLANLLEVVDDVVKIPGARISRRLLARDRQHYSSARGGYWQLEAGTALEVFVNKSFPFEFPLSRSSNESTALPIPERQKPESLLPAPPERGSSKSEELTRLEARIAELEQTTSSTNKIDRLRSQTQLRHLRYQKQLIESE
jgi:hypothetical protein